MSFPNWKGQAAGTAPQTLSIVGQDLSISGGNTVVIPVTTIPGPGQTLQIGTLEAEDDVYVGPFAAPTISLIGATGAITTTGPLQADTVACNSVSTTDVTTTNINGQPVADIAGNWSQYPATQTVDLSGQNLFGGTGYPLGLVSLEAINATGTDINLTASATSTALADIILTAQNGLGGNIELNAKPSNIGLNVGGSIKLTATGGQIGPIVFGGNIELDANTGGIGDYGSATSAIKLSAAGINNYAGAIPSVASTLGYIFNFGNLGINSCVGLPPVLPNFPGTNYSYATGGVGYGGIRFESPAGVEMVNSTDLYVFRQYPYYNTFLVGTHPDMLISGRNNLVGNNQRVVLEKVRSLEFDGDGGPTAITGIQTINGVAYPPPVATPTYGPAATFLVSPNGNDLTGTGSTLLPFATIGAAIAASTALPDSTEVNILIGAGTYTESPIITRPNLNLIGQGNSSSSVNIDGVLTFDIVTTTQTTLTGTVSNCQFFSQIVIAGNTTTAVTQAQFRFFNCAMTHAQDITALFQATQTSAIFPVFTTLEQCNLDVGSNAFPNNTVPCFRIQTGTLTIFDSRVSFNGAANVVLIEEGNFQTRNMNIQNNTASTAPGALVRYQNTASSPSNLQFYSRFQYVQPTTDTGTNKVAIQYAGTGGVIDTLAFCVLGVRGGVGDAISKPGAGAATLNYGNNLVTALSPSTIDPTISKTLLEELDQGGFVPLADADLDMAGFTVLNALDLNATGNLKMNGLTPQIIVTDPSPIPLQLQATSGVEILNSVGNFGALKVGGQQIYDSAAPAQFGSLQWDDAAGRFDSQANGAGPVNQLAYVSDIVALFRPTNDIYVAPNGAGTNLGGMDQPLQTIAQALALRATLGAGPVTIHLASGTYVESPVLPAGTYLVSDAGSADPATDPATIRGTVTCSGTNTGLTNLAVDATVATSGLGNIVALTNVTITTAAGGFSVSGNATVSIIGCRINNSSSGCVNVNSGGVYTILRSDLTQTAAASNVIQCGGSLTLNYSTLTHTSTSATAASILRFFGAGAHTVVSNFCRLAYTSQTVDTGGNKCCIQFAGAGAVTAEIAQMVLDCRGATTGGALIECIQDPGAGAVTLLYGGLQAAAPANFIAPTVTKTAMIVVP